MKLVKIYIHKGVQLKLKSCFQGFFGYFIQLKSFSVNTSSNAFPAVRTGIFLFYKSQIPRKQFRSSNECNDKVYVLKNFQEIAYLSIRKLIWYWWIYWFATYGLSTRCMLFKAKKHFTYAFASEYCHKNDLENNIFF